MDFTPITRIKDFGLYFLLIFAFVLFSNITAKQIWEKFKTWIPFILFVFFATISILFVKKFFVFYLLKGKIWEVYIIKQDTWTLLNILVKSCLSILLFIVVFLKMSFSDFLKGMESLPMAHRLTFFMTENYRKLYIYLYKTKRGFKCMLYRLGSNRYRKLLRMIFHLMSKLSERFISSQKRKITNIHFIDRNNIEMLSTPALKFSYLDFLYMAGIIVILLCITSGLIYKMEFFCINNFHIWHRL